jgi:Protein of unknown function (DUF1566)
MRNRIDKENKTMANRLVLGLAVAVFVVAASLAHAAVIDEDLKCKEAKVKAAGLKALTLMKAFGTNTKKPNSVKLGTDISKAQSKFTKLFTAPEAKEWCDTTGDAPAVEVAVDDCVNQLVTLIIDGLVSGVVCDFPATGQTSCWDSTGVLVSCAGTGHDGDIRAGAPLGYMDNADGTVTDLNTGLMWEKKSDDGSIHDKDTVYTWDNAFIVHVAGLNGANFAGYEDWRVPNYRELVSILDLEMNTPAVGVAFNNECVGGCDVSTCSCTITGSNIYYWSSTSLASSPAFAWAVNFTTGDPTGRTKTLTHHVRAVRGGL